MLNALRVDFRRYLMTKSFLLIVLLASVVQPAFMEIVLQGLSKAMNWEVVITMNDFAAYSSMASIYLAVLVTMFLYTEAGEGIIRNKMISGKKRYEILFSYCMVNSVLAVFLQIVSVLMVALVGFVVGASFQNSAMEVIRFTGVNLLAGVAISVLYTVVYLCFCTVKVAIAIPAGIAVVVKIVMVFIMDALYTDSGIPKVSGMTLTVYEGFDRYCPFFHMTGELRWDNGSYLIGNTVLIVVSMIVGILVFGRKDIK